MDILPRSHAVRPNTPIFDNGCLGRDSNQGNQPYETMKYICLLAVLTVLVLPSCCCNQDGQIADLKGLEHRLAQSEGSNKKARFALSAALQEAEKAREDALAAHALVAEMEASSSPFAVQVENLRSGYEARIVELQRHIEATDQVLAEQWKELEMTQQDLKAAKNAVAVAERNVQAAEKRNESLIKDNERIQAESDKWREKHAKIAKYRWAVFGAVVLFGLGVLAKFRGLFF